MAESTQETQIASQTHSQRLEEEADNTNCWGLLWPISSRDNSRPKPWRFNKDKRIYVVGRSNASDVKIASQIISSNHCYIEWDGIDGANAGITITDVSRNGTFVKGSKIAKNCASLLHDGDEVAFGVAISNQNGESHRYTFRIPVVRAALKGIHVNYELQNELGRGSFAAVVKALHKPTGRFFAVKVIPKPQSLLQPQTVKMLEREMAILRKLQHPNIVNLFEVVPSEVELCLVMELVSGGDLFDFITKRGYLSEDLSGQLTSQLCDAMAYIHYQGITHRDLKPENILLTNDDPPRVKVADFGLAKCVNSKTMLKTMCGTPSYLAPEVVLQENGAGYDQKVDSWSAGAIVFAMLTGQGAFNENENKPLAQRVRERRVIWQYMQERECSAESMTFINQLMQFNPEDRMSLTAALSHPWLKPRYWPSGVPSYFPQSDMHDDVPQDFDGSVMSAPVSAPTPDEMVGVSEEFQSLELENDSISDSPAYIDFEDEVGGPSELTRSQDLKRAIEEREQSWDLVDEPLDPNQTPLARPKLQLLDDERTARPRPAVITDIQGQVPPPVAPAGKRRKRKLSSDEMMTPGGATSSGQEGGTGKLGPRKASKASQYDTPTTATRGRFPNGVNRKASLRSSGKGPIPRDYVDEDDE